MIKRDANGRFAKVAGSKAHLPAKARDAIRKTGQWKANNPLQNFKDRSQRKLGDKNGLKVPKYYRHVQLNLSPTDKNAHILFRGKDDKQRTVKTYVKGYREQQDVKKFSRVGGFNNDIRKIMQKIRSDAKGGKNAETAKALLLIQKTGFRVGGSRDTKAEKQAYGATTLRREHLVGLTAKTAHLNFTGKKGVGQDHVVHSKTIAKVMSERSDRTGKLFDTTDTKANKYLKDVSGKDYKVKDFRTYVANKEARKAFKKETPPENKKQLKERMTSVATHVSNVLGNTPGMALKSYIDHKVFDPWKSKVDTLTSKRSKK